MPNDRNIFRPGLGLRVPGMLGVVPERPLFDESRDAVRTWFHVKNGRAGGRAAKVRSRLVDTLLSTPCPPCICPAAQSREH